MLGTKSPLSGALFLFVGTFSLACASADAEEPVDQAPGRSSGSVCPSNSTLTYENFGMAFFTSYCTRCHGENPPDGSRHGAPRGLNWDNLETVRTYSELIDTMAAAGPDAINTMMPPGAPQPSNDERRALGEWLVCGAP